MAAQVDLTCFDFISDSLGLTSYVNPQLDSPFETIARDRRLREHSPENRKHF